jgi:hypothetical protein
VVTPDTQPTGRPNARMRQTVGDMVRSMLVVLAFVAVLLLVTWRPQPDAVKPVDTTSAVTLATMQADFPVEVAVGLSDGWRPTSARWEPTEKSDGEPVLHIGYVTPTEAYAQVSMAATTDAAYLAEQTDDGVPVGTRMVGDASWEQWERADRRSLVRTDDGTATIVSGTAAWEELAVLAGALEVQAEPAG